MNILHSRKNEYIICYDITNNKLRTKIEKMLKNYGIRIQYSIFDCKISPEVYKNELNLKLKALSKNEKFIKESDSILIFNLCGSCYKKVRAYGNNKLRKQNYFIV